MQAHSRRQLPSVTTDTAPPTVGLKCTPAGAARWLTFRENFPDIEREGNYERGAADPLPVAGNEDIGLLFKRKFPLDGRRDAPVTRIAITPSRGIIKLCGDNCVHAVPPKKRLADATPALPRIAQASDAAPAAPIADGNS